MKLLITSDWQASSENLHTLQLFVDQMFAYCKKHKVNVIAHLGDLKHAYNPVDVRVYNFAIRTIRRAKDAGIEWIQLEGNHDRVSMSDGAGNWHPALRAAGAITISKPSYVPVRSMRLACVPYLSDPLALQNAFKHVLTPGKADLLLFHASIYGCQSNVLTKMKEGVSLDKIYFNRYKYCVSGHIHLPQKVGENVYFVGSPFSQDWGEANQTKRFLVFDSNTNELISVPSEVPGMYDPSWPNFKETSPTNWRGTKIRIHIPVDASAQNVQKLLLKATTKAEEKYKGAIITAIPEFIDSKENKPKKLSVADDEAALVDYIDSTCPPFLSRHKKQLVQFLKFQLERQGYVRRSSQSVKILEAEGRNFLAFKKVKIDFRYKGILVVTGVNKDWPKRSNGVGKTSLMSLPLVALTGKTLKEQSTDRWVRRDSKGLAFARLKMRLQDKRKCTVVRMRHPTKLKLFINNQERSTGIGLRGTQQAIETATGLTWECLRSAIYIDQSEINKILQGTDTERKSIFSKLLNLERFELAKEILKKELKTLAKLKEDTESAIDSTEEKIKELKIFINDTDVSADIKDTEKKLRKATLIARWAKRSLRLITKKHKRYNKRYNKTILKLRLSIGKAATHRETLLELKGAFKQDINQLVLVKDKCPTCKQGIDDAWRKQRSTILAKGLKIVEEKIAKVDKEINTFTRQKDADSSRLDKLGKRLSECTDSYTDANRSRNSLRKDLGHYSSSNTLTSKYKRRLKKEKNNLILLRSALKAYEYDTSMLTYGLKVFSKDGLPAYMIQALCPLLNIAAEKYARLFSENEIKVKFVIAEDGSIEPKIDNPHGGEEIDDQSKGETRIASIISSFSVREVTNPSNLLILDEPGEGLDQYNARLFAKMLKEIAKTFGTVLLTTHSPFILAELEDERKLCIEKKNGIARLVA